MSKGAFTEHALEMTWHLSIAIKDRSALLFRGSTNDFTELSATAREARRLYPEAEIWVRPPFGAIYLWDEQC
jgi:hypothetical protein